MLVYLSLDSFPGLQSQLQCGGRLGKTPSYNGVSLVHRLFRPSSFLSGESLGTRLEWRQVDIWRHGELQCTVRDKPRIQTSFYVGVLPGLPPRCSCDWRPNEAIFHCTASQCNSYCFWLAENLILMQLCGHFNKSAFPQLKIVCSEQSVLLCWLRFPSVVLVL